MTVRVLKNKKNKKIQTVKNDEKCNEKRNNLSFGG